MDDAFASLANECKHSTSQECRLRHCRFCRESQDSLGCFTGDESSPGDEIPVASTGIVMVSLPESTENDNSPPEVFQTPPEETLMVSSDEQRMEIDKQFVSRAAGIDVVDDDGIKAVDDDSVHHFDTVDLSKDSDPGFSREKSPANKSLSSPATGGVDASAHAIGEDRLGEVFKNDTKTFGISEGKSPAKEDLGFSKSMVGAFGSEKNMILQPSEVDAFVDVSVADKSSNFPVEKNLGLLKATEGTHCNSASKSSEDLQMHVESAFEAIGDADDAKAFHREILENPNEESVAKKKLEFSNTPLLFPCNSVTEVLQSEPNSINGVLEFNKDTTKEVSPLKGAEKVPELDNRQSHKICSEAEEDLTSKTTRRQLPSSIRGLMQNAAEGLIPGSSSSRSQQVKNLVDAIIRLSGERDNTSDLGDVDILDIAKQRGMTFPRPRWWPPEGY